MAEPASTLAAGSVGTCRNPVPRPAGAGAARLRPGAAPGPRGVRDLRHPSPRRDNVILVCHALSGDAHAAGFAKTPPAESTRDGFGAEDRDGTAGKGLGWWDGMIGPGKAFDTDRFFVVSTNLLGGCRGTTGPSSIDPATGRPYGSDFPVITVADMVRTERAFLDAARHRAARGGGRRLARRDAGARVGDPVPRPGRRRRGDRQHARPAPAGRGLERDRARRDHARPGLAGRPLLRHRPRARRRHGRGPDGRPHHLPVRAGAGRQVRPAAAVRRRHPLHDHRAGVRGRELPAPPGRLVRPALRRQHLPLHVARADLLRPRPAARRRIARAGAGGRLGADAADRVQLRLAVPAVGVERRSPTRSARSASRSSST